MSDLRVAYGEICSYSGMSYPSGWSLDHFVPKSGAPALAYEWSNYRLTIEQINNNKGERTGLLDPFRIEAEWFVLDFATFYVRPNAGLNDARRGEVERTIRVLGLNAEEFGRLRYSVVRGYAEGLLDITFVADRYPFIRLELERQGMTADVMGWFSAP